MVRYDRVRDVCADRKAVCNVGEGVCTSMEAVVGIDDNRLALLAANTDEGVDAVHMVWADMVGVGEDVDRVRVVDMVWNDLGVLAHDMGADVGRHKVVEDMEGEGMVCHLLVDNKEADRKVGVDVVVDKDDLIYKVRGVAADKEVLICKARDVVADTDGIENDISVLCCILGVQVYHKGAEDREALNVVMALHIWDRYYKEEVADRVEEAGMACLPGVDKETHLVVDKEREEDMASVRKEGADRMVEEDMEEDRNAADSEEIES